VNTDSRLDLVLERNVDDQLVEHVKRGARPLPLGLRRDRRRALLAWLDHSDALAEFILATDLTAT
jgi:hypothetical protein